MSFGKFQEDRIRQRIIFEKAQKYREENPDIDSDEEYDEGKVYGEDKKMKNLIGTGYFEKNQIEFSDTKMMEFGNLSMGVKPSNQYVSESKEMQQGIEKFYKENPEEAVAVFNTQKKVDKLIKLQNSKDTVKEWFN